MTALRYDEDLQEGRADGAALLLSALSAISLWLSLGVVAVDAASGRIVALPAFLVLIALAIALPAVAWFARLRLEHAWPLAISLVVWLPFLGLSAVWDGPIEGVVWSVVVVGLIASRPRRAPGAFSDPRISPVMAALLIALTSALVFGQVRNMIPGGDEPHYLAATQSLLHDGDLKVANNYEQGDYLEYFPGRLEPHFLQRSKSGEIYSIHAPGVSVIVMPAFAVAGYPGAVWTIILVAAISAALMWRLAFAISGSVAAAWAGVTGVAWSAPYFFHTFTIYPEIVGGLCVLLGVWLLVALAEGRDPGASGLLGGGAALAVLPWLHTRFAVLAGIIGILVVLRLTTRPAWFAKAAAFLAVPAILGVAWFTFFYVIWGSANPTVAYGADTSTAMSYVPRGVIGLVFDQQFGVLTTAPIYVMALVGAAMLFRSHPRLTIELALIVVPYVLVVASYAMWWGGAAAPGRFLVAILPLAALPMAKAWAGGGILRPVALVLSVVSATLIVPRAIEDSGRFIFNNRSGVDATVQWLSANTLLPSVVPSVHADGGSAALRDGLAWLGLFTIGAIAAGVLGRRTSRGGGLAAAGVMIAMVVSVVSSAGGAARPDRQLVMFERLRAWHASLLEVPGWKSLERPDLLSRLSIDVPAGGVMNRVPAGEYEFSAPLDEAEGALRIFLGRNDDPIATPSLDELRSASSPFRLRLPVMARNLNVRLESRTPPAVVLRLRPVGLITPLAGRPATRAARFGQTRAFFFDDWAYPERDGFWTRAEGEATVVLDSGAAHPSGLPMSVTAGQEPTTVWLSTGDWQESVTLNAGEQRDVLLPASSGGVWSLRVRSGAGFRPSEREPGNRDVRKLAAWIAMR